MDSVFSSRICYQNRPCFLRVGEFCKQRDANEDAWKEAQKKLPVEREIALDKYLQACVCRLANEHDIDTPLIVKVHEKRNEDRPGTTFISLEDGIYSLTFTPFGGFGSAARSGLGAQQRV